MSLEVFWSDRLEVLAEGLFAHWENGAGGEPFDRTCVVVGDLSTRNWLQDYFLLRRKSGSRRILANIDYKPVAEFVNDWLAAVRGKDGIQRNAAAHPYAKEVLAWRIDAILRAADPGQNPVDTVFGPLLSYIGEKASALRRYELAAKLAEMFDDYLNYRYTMLDRWENGGELKRDEEAWQRELYRRLVRVNGNTYTKDYVGVFSGESNPETAFVHGFPRYKSIHVFDVAFAPWPYFEFLKRIADSIPTVVWSFSPCPGFWMDVEGKRESIRQRVTALRSAMEIGDEALEPSMPEIGNAADRALLGALATGGRGALFSEVDISEGNCYWLSDVFSQPVPAEAAETGCRFKPLRELDVELHVCHSPRRELEAVRNGIYRFFEENPQTKPGEVLVLCADWATYAPLAEAVFGTEREVAARIPLKLDGLVADESPLMHSFGELLAFRENRFEVSAVFSLLSVPTIRGKFGIAADGIDVLKRMVRDANIHWGYDDRDVAESLGLGLANPAEPYPFTWRRGLDRLELDALMGPRGNPDSLVSAGEIGVLRPCGKVEQERTRLVAALDKFVKQLHAFRAELRGGKTAEDWGERLREAVDCFYNAGDDDSGSDNRKELTAVRRAIKSAEQHAMDAWVADGGVGVPPEIEAEVFLSAVQSAIRGVRPYSAAVGDAVRFAPLKSSAATPAKLVWVCGLNDGKFPRDGTRPSFDQIGRHPTPYDASLRERDGFSLLKAVLGARERLALSYVGHDIRSNEKIPPAVPLSDLLDWFDRERKNGITRYEHPLQSYSSRYFYEFEGDSPLPPNYSTADRAAAAAILAKADKRPDENVTNTITAFKFASEGETVVYFDDLSEFLAKPNAFLRRRLKMWGADASSDELVDEEATATKLSYGERVMIKLGDDDKQLPGDLLIEEGRACDRTSVEEAVDQIKNGNDRNKIMRRKMRFERSPEGYKSESVRAVDILRRVAEANPARVDVCRLVKGHNVLVTGMMKFAQDNGTDHHMVYSEYGADELGSAESELLVRHLVGHAAGLRFLSVIMYGDGKLMCIHPMDAERANQKLDEILELAFNPLPENLPDLNVGWKDDALPDELREMVLRDMVFVSSARLQKA